MHTHRFTLVLTRKAKFVGSLPPSNYILLIISLNPQPAPETEEEMMVEVFKYTERVVNMIRPRKLLFMAIGIWTYLFWL